MANQSQKGKAFEYATALAIYNLYGSNKAVFIQNTALEIAESNFANEMTVQEQSAYQLAADKGAQILFELEPLLTSDNSILEIRLADDNEGIEGDVRDVIITKPSINWEIGISCKHNHTALKHQRLSANIDFGNSWAGYPVSQTYWNAVLPVFDQLADFRANGVNWRDLGNYGINKAQDVYIPILNAFLAELNLLINTHYDLAPKFMEYLAGKKDFYKFVMNESSRTIDVYTYNLHGDLNQGGNELSIVSLPTTFTHIGWKTNRNGTTSDNTVIVSMDNGWEISLRLHSAASLVETSLKFDTQPIHIPNSLIKITESY